MTLNNAESESAATGVTQRFGTLRFRLNDVILTLLIPAAVYALVFTYQYGYFQYFNLPTDFIVLDWSSALNALTGLAPVLFTAPIVFGLVVLFTGLLYLTDEEF